LNVNCVKCHRLCKTCHGNTRDDCDECRIVDNIAPIEGNTCNCKKGYFDDSNKIIPNEYCQKCSKFCLTCDIRFDNCQTCIDNPGVQMINNDCKCNAPGYFVIYNTTTNRDDCVTCHPLCKRCTGPLSTQCDLCFTNKGAIYVDPSTCKCPSGYYYDTTTEICEQCDPRCSECFGNSWKDCYKCNLRIAMNIENHPTWCTYGCDYISNFGDANYESFFKYETQCKCIFLIKFSTIIKSM